MSARRTGLTDLVLINGGTGSRLLEKAVKIGANEKDRGGHPVFVLDPKLQKDFGKFTELNAIREARRVG